MKNFWFGALFLTACQTKTDRALSQATAASSTEIAVAASTTPPNTAPATRIVFSDALVRTPWVDTKQVMDTSLDAPNFQCAPKVFTQKDTLTLRAEVPHGGWLDVNQPDGTDFRLIGPVAEAAGYALMDTATFANTLIVRFRADLKSRPYVYGRDTLETVFRVPGDYRFTIGYNLATEYDDEDPNWHCTVRLVASP